MASHPGCHRLAMFEMEYTLGFDGGSEQRLILWGGIGHAIFFEVALILWGIAAADVRSHSNIK